MKDSAALISVHGKTGFFSKEKAVKIYDADGRIFYDFEPKNRRFNLPQGRYFTDNTLRKLAAPLNYKLPILPPPDRKRKDFQTTLHFAKNPNTASIYLDTGKIVIDSEAAQSFTIPQIAFIYYHETGHLQYESEKNCDKFATREMLKAGFNPSQIFVAAAGTLKKTRSNTERCEAILNDVKESENGNQ